MKCLQCLNETNNPKFCNNSCAATYNNMRKARKTTNKLCKNCNKHFEVNYKTRARQHCPGCCKSRAYINPASFNFEHKTVAEFKSEHTEKHKRPWTDRIRSFARQKYSNKDKNKYPCINCGYDLHTEVCHKRAITDFPDDATLSEINGIHNILFLCRNCHWEFDHNYLHL